MLRPLASSMSQIRIMIINPNSNASMTEGLRAGIEGLGYNNVREILLPRVLHQSVQRWQGDPGSYFWPTC